MSKFETGLFSTVLCLAISLLFAVSVQAESWLCGSSSIECNGTAADCARLRAAMPCIEKGAKSSFNPQQILENARRVSRTAPPEEPANLDPSRLLRVEKAIQPVVSACRDGKDNKQCRKAMEAFVPGDDLADALVESLQWAADAFWEAGKAMSDPQHYGE